MTDKQQRFVEEYMIDFNATQAAIRAGYSPKSAARQGRELLNKPPCAAALARARAELSAKTGVSAERVINQAAAIVFADITQIVDMNTAEVRPEATREQRAAIASVKVRYIPVKREGENGEMEVAHAIEREIRFCDKNKPLELLFKHLGLDDKHPGAPGKSAEDDPLTKALKEEAERMQNATD